MALRGEREEDHRGRKGWKVRKGKGGERRDELMAVENVSERRIGTRITGARKWKGREWIRELMGVELVEDRQKEHGGYNERKGNED